MLVEVYKYESFVDEICLISMNQLRLNYFNLIGGIRFKY